MAQKKYVSLSKLSTFLDNLKNIFATAEHEHSISDIKNLEVNLNNKAENNHIHEITDVTGLREDLDAKTTVQIATWGDDD